MSEKWMRVGTWCLMGLLGVAAIGGVGTSVWLHGKLRAYEQANAPQETTATQESQKFPRTYTVKSGDDIIGIAIAYGVRPSELMDLNNLHAGDAVIPGQQLLLPTEVKFDDTGSEVCAPSPQRQVRSAPPPIPVREMRVEKIDYSGEDEIYLRFSERPDMSVLRDYLTVGPVKGGVVLEYNGDTGHPRVIVRGDFLFRTNLTLRVRAGCPALQELKAKPLAQDFVRTLQRKDAAPRVRLVDSGRYLPPGGTRKIAVDSVNVGKLHCAAAAIPAANIVQLLARENGRYDEHLEADSDATENLADKMVTWSVETLGRPNEHRISALDLRQLPDAASNGVFLVAVRSADRERSDWKQWWEDRRGERWNPNRYRLVCVTDVGLTVRCSDNRLVVWATSLMTGKPVANCSLDVYGANNRHLGSGRTDANGLCDLVCSDRATPFAVVAKTADGSDTSFVCLSGRQSLDERWLPEGSREPYLGPKDVTAFVWTERDIYRHDERMMLHALVRNGLNQAPGSFPVDLRLVDPDEKVFQHRTLVTDALGAVACETFTVPAERPSGRWRLEVATPGKASRVLGSHEVSVEEFAPPQIRVAVEAKGDNATNFAFKVSAEHLYGGPAQGLLSAGAVVFEDVPFTPKAWTGWRFGNEQLGLKPSYRRLVRQALDAEGQTVYTAPLFASSGSPKAAVRATGEGTVFEEGGRAARTRASRVVHYYPFYVGTTLGNNVRVPDAGFAKVKVACVHPDGTRLSVPRKLKVSFERVESVYSCKEDERGWTSWTCDRVQIPVQTPVTEVTTKADGDVELEIPIRTDGDYVLKLNDTETNVSFGGAFWLGSRGDDAVRAPLANPSEVTISPDKKIYRPGDVPRLLVKAPFAGWALLTVLRDDIVSTRVLKLDGATQEVTLQPVDPAWAPNVDVSLSVVQSAENGGRHQTVRAHGRVSIPVRRWENEIPVQVRTSYVVSEQGGGTLTADITAKSTAATGTVAVVTVVDEGINLLTGWKTLDPVGHFAELRVGSLELHDLFENLLPVWDGDPAKVRGVKTGGGFGAEMLGRVSPVPTRRFKPLARWQFAVPLTNGVGRTTFQLPEFIGEVRVSAVAYSATAVGAGDVQQKVTPKLVFQPDAPRFAAPGDTFDVTVTLANRAGHEGTATWTLTGTGPCEVADTNPHTEKLAEGASVTRTVRVTAKDVPGTATLVYTAEGFGERHTQTIKLPVRPAVAARETRGTVLLNPGESRTFEASADGAVPAATVRQFTANGSALAQLVGALEYLAEYPHGCLEQTTSRIFPLVAADGFLNRLGVGGNLTNRAAYVAAGVKRVSSMIRAKDFVMWPDCDYAPWDREVSLYAAHFLIAAEKSGVPLSLMAKQQVMKFLASWSVTNNLSIAAYACQTLALAGQPASDRMLTLYDQRTKLTTLDRARLARAFLCTGDRPRATELLAFGAVQPTSVKDAAFTLLALLDLDPADARLPALVRYLETQRAPDRFSWGTTGENAHALLALGAYYRHHPVKDGKVELVLKTADGSAKPLAEKRRETVRGAETVSVANTGAGSGWLVWRKLELPRVEAVTNEASFIKVDRWLLTPGGLPATVDEVTHGALLVVELSLATDAPRTFNDLVIQDLLPAAFEPVSGGLDPTVYGWAGNSSADWVMRADARDDRMLVFSKRFTLTPRRKVLFHYPVRVVSAGDFVWPGTTVEAMYAPEVHAALAPSRITVEK